MTITKAVLRARTLQFADAVGSTRWDATPNGEVDQIIGEIQDQEWWDLLDTNPYLRYSTVTLAADSNGRYQKIGLDSGSGDTATRHYKVLGFVIPGGTGLTTPYEPVLFSQYSTAEANASVQYVYWEEGDAFVALPINPGANAVITVNHLPARQDQLAGEASIVVFPESFENIVARQAAADLLLKGGAESDAADILERKADKQRQKLRNKFSRATTRPTQMVYSDSSTEWGG